MTFALKVFSRLSFYLSPALLDIRRHPFPPASLFVHNVHAGQRQRMIWTLLGTGSLPVVGDLEGSEKEKSLKDILAGTNDDG